MHYDYIVIGAGAAGLSAAALLEKKLKGKKSVALLEAHHYPGGCSSYFERHGFIFDAGATTLSGIKDEGPLWQLILELDLKLDLRKVDPGLVIKFEDKEVNLYANLDKWIDELERKFPNINHEEIWKKIYHISNLGWNLSKKFPELPLAKWSDFKKLFKSDLVFALKAFPYLLRSVEHSLSLEQLKDKNYSALINELLFITAQNNSHDTPMLLGAMGLTYPEDTWCIFGGMKAFTEALSSKCSNLFLRHEVQKIEKINVGFKLITNKGEFTCSTLISSLPTWNHNKLFNKPIFNVRNQNDCWSAFMLYMTIPTNTERRGIYYQIHCKNIPWCESHSFFVSLSHPEDSTRSSSRQVVTISCHTKVKNWENLSQEEYLRRKLETEEYILRAFCQHFLLERKQLKNILTGTSQTFLRYTRRARGLVGGLPHSLKNKSILKIKMPAPYQSFYMIGDTQFPGQGIAAVVLGAMNLVRKLEN